MLWVHSRISPKLFPLQILQKSSSIHTHLGSPSVPVNSTPNFQRPVTPKQQQVVSIRDNPCFDPNTTNIVNNFTLPNEVENTTGKGGF